MYVSEVFYIVFFILFIQNTNADGTPLNISICRPYKIQQCNTENLQIKI